MRLGLLVSSLRLSLSELRRDFELVIMGWASVKVVEGCVILYCFFLRCYIIVGKFDKFADLSEPLNMQFAML